MAYGTQYSGDIIRSMAGEMVELRPSNPFGVTKADDLNDDQIQALWVDVGGAAEELSEFARPTSPMPTFILGAKGSGKTHLMRYHAFELQKLRYEKRKVSIREGIKDDSYIGIYMRCSGLNSGRFKGKRKDNEFWAELFAYYIELWLCQHLLHIVETLGLGSSDGDEREFVRELIELFDKPPQPVPTTISELVAAVGEMQRNLDFQVNNIVITGELSVEILATRGRLVFGIPKILAKRYSFLNKVLFAFCIDEFENLSVEQQKLINTLVREKELPSTLRVGSRLYGVKTYATDSAEEENLHNSEFEIIYLDELFRKHKNGYAKFARSLISKRLVASYEAETDADPPNVADVDWSGYLEQFDEAWNSPNFLALVKDKPSSERRHFITLTKHLTSIGIEDQHAASIVDQLSVPQYPLLEKVNIFLIYQAISKGIPLQEQASEIRSMCVEFLEKRNAKGSYVSTLEHYKGDLVAQLNRENNGKQYYVGLDNFIRMSGGLPRALLTILRSVLDWSFFNGETPFRSNRISKDAQYKGVKDASDWYFNSMRKAGDDGVAIQVAIGRLARLFKANRFADKPVECSLVTFSIAEEDASHEAMHVLRLAENRSFLNRIAGGQKDKNSERVMMKFQLSNMLSPRWDLPLGRRGAVTLDPRQFEAIFDMSKSEEFEKVLNEWRSRMSAPRFGKTRTVESDESQATLF